MKYNFYTLYFCRDALESMNDTVCESSLQQVCLNGVTVVDLSKDFCKF